MRDLPAIGRAAAAAARFARRNRGSGPATVPPAPPTGGDELVTLPTATVFLNADEWDTRADSLGGTTNTLAAAVAARIAERLGRVAADGSVNVAMPVNERTADDTRANAVAMVDIRIDPAPAATDLRDIRSATKQALIRHRNDADERKELLPLVPLLPQRVTKRMASVATGGTTNVVVSSNLGEAPSAVNQPDGTDADYVALLSRYPTVTKAMVDQLGGVLVVHSARTDNKAFVSVLGYQPGQANTNDALRRELIGALSDFSLAPVRGWECPAPVGAAQGR